MLNAAASYPLNAWLTREKIKPKLGNFFYGAAMFERATPMILAVTLTCSACAQQGKNEWTEIDYSKVYKAATTRDTDAGYRAPTVVGCVDDDLYNCR